MIVLILTNRKFSFKNTHSFEIGPSDHYQKVCTIRMQAFVDVVEIDALKISAEFKGGQLSWGIFLKTVTGIFPEYLFYRTPTGNCFWLCWKLLSRNMNWNNWFTYILRSILWNVSQMIYWKIWLDVTDHILNLIKKIYFGTNEKEKNAFEETKNPI